jgi:hypothetical protein
MVELSLNNEYFDINLGNPKVLGIWFEYGHIEFPEKGWSDFAIIVLGWWCSCIRNILNNPSQSGELDFMDGPFQIRTGILKENELELLFIEYDKIIENKTVPFDLFVRGILQASNKLLQFLNANEVVNADVTSLEGQYALLHKSWKSFQRSEGQRTNMSTEEKE